ncbi:MAG: plasmid encoded RepA protein [bacterium]|nr:plasmid encoded RepA protein [bacterium]
MNKDHKDGLTHIGTLIEADPRFKPPTSKTQWRLIEASEQIAMGEDGSPTYQHTVLCQTSLPYRRTKERVLERRNGRTFLRVEAGTAYSEQQDRWVELPLPFGPKARLVLIHLNTAAIVTRSHVIDVGDSMTAYFSQVLSSEPDQTRELNGREIRSMKEQLSSLAAAEMRFAVGGDLKKQGRAAIISEFDLWFPRAPNQRVLWPSTVTLSLDYYQSLINHAVPLDPRAVAALSHSAMGLDIYAWLAQRLCRIHPKTEALVPWVSLHAQFGSGYKLIRQFRAVFLKTLRESVFPAYPQAQVRPSPKGLHLKLSPPPISRKKLLA